MATKKALALYDGIVKQLQPGDTLDGAGGGGSVATDTIFDAKGDLPVGTGSNTAVRVAVGVDGDVLTANSAATAGVSWKPPVGNRLSMYNNCV